ncbi:hypothetical protein Q9L58_004839 [Maublancomyces gigas]|uniref:Uncharacterized protein n=1 Tax=Discina gigas TaxID=1032678 RepID=A0ABR3GJP2_9PEZI
MSISQTDQDLLNYYNTLFEEEGGATRYMRDWVLLKFRLFEESLPKTRSTETTTEASEELNRRFAELAAEIDQLRLQVQPSMYTPSCSSTTSSSTNTTITASSVTPLTSNLPSAGKPFFFFNSRDNIPALHGQTIKEVYAFLTGVERQFKLRNYELQLPADNTSGWVNYALMRLSGTVEIWATTRWGICPDISWETFRKAMVSDFISDTAIRELSAGYVGLVASSSGNIRGFNDSFREAMLLLEFVGKGFDEKAAVRDYEEKIRQNKKVALAFAQFLTVERIVGGSSVVSLADAMKYCENVDSI